MILTDHQISLLQAPSTSIWAGCGTSAKSVEIVRLSGVKVADDRMHLDLFIPHQYAKELLRHLQENPGLAVLGSSILTFEAYQVKGNYLNHRPSTPEEEHYQKEYLQGFSQRVTSIGVKAGYGFNKYFTAPCITIQMKAAEVYEQTPKAGTGAKIS